MRPDPSVHRVGALNVKLLILSIVGMSLVGGFGGVLLWFFASFIDQCEGG